MTHYLLRLTAVSSAMLGLVWVAPIILAYLSVRTKLQNASLSQKSILYLIGFILIGAWTVLVLWGLSRAR
jgi:hypothetical protein